LPFDLARFYLLWGEISDLDATQELLSWDQETMMPRQGAEGRAEVVATVAGLRHRALTSLELVEGNRRR
jgi:Zn-dependent M32 family carboxypeptidase